MNMVNGLTLNNYCYIEYTYVQVIWIVRCTGRACEKEIKALVLIDRHKLKDGECEEFQWINRVSCGINLNIANFSFLQ